MGLHSKESSRDVVLILLFELLDRLARFHLHFEEISTNFYDDERSHERGGYDTEHLLGPYRDCLKKVLICAINISSPLLADDKHDEDTLDSSLMYLQKLMQLLNSLHQQLGLLPRPKEPSELKRFGRVLYKHSMNILGGDISIYVDEKTSEETYAFDPLAEFKESEINHVVEQINENLLIPKGLEKISKFDKDDSVVKFHITIPRIDASNTCRWPTLVHELAHKLGDNRFFENDNILKNFEEVVSSHNYDLKRINLGNDICLASWLHECWCDLFGAIVMGPSFWFSQATAFLFAHEINDFGRKNCSHPPPLFRLLLITNVLRHRFKEAMFEDCERGLKEYRKLFDSLDGKNSDGFTNNPEIKQIFPLFKAFFIEHFFVKIDGKLSLKNPTLNKHIDSLVKYSSTLKEETISKMVKMLANGIPVTSYREPSRNDFKERPSHVQEVLFAAWMYRIGEFKKEQLTLIKTKLCSSTVSDGEIWDVFLGDIVSRFKQFNYAVLRSIQVGEWFDLLEDSTPLRDSLLNVIHDIDSKRKPIERSNGVLVDTEILTLLAKEEIVVSPIISLPRQLGSTSLDLRLGSSFQVYYPNQVGVIDLNDKKSMNQATRSSNLVDLDFCESITLATGQFLLAHSMEYIILPDYISAELDGRSSFARLGIEIHMTAGFIDPGFQGVLTYEIYNAGPNPIKLYPGLRIGQLRFLYGECPDESYKRQTEAKYRGLLQHHNSLQANDYEIGLFSKE